MTSSLSLRQGTRTFASLRLRWLVHDDMAALWWRWMRSNTTYPEGSWVTVSLTPTRTSVYQGDGYTIEPRRSTSRTQWRNSELWDALRPALVFRAGTLSVNEHGEVAAALGDSSQRDGRGAAVNKHLGFCDPRHGPPGHLRPGARRVRDDDGPLGSPGETNVSEPKRIQMRGTAKGWRKAGGSDLRRASVEVGKPVPYGWRLKAMWTAIALGWRANPSGRPAAAVRRLPPGVVAGRTRCARPACARKA